MTQAQDACVPAGKKPSAIVVGVGAELGLGAAFMPTLCRAGISRLRCRADQEQDRQGCAHDRWRRWQRRGDRNGYDERR
jgi:hypothetical protein